MFKKHKTRWLMILAIPVILLINSFAAPEADLDIKSKIQTQRLAKKVYEDNKTFYDADDGEHTIYWAQGVNAPKMTNDPLLLGTDGYFGYQELDGFGTYQAEYAPGNGYYDHNKNFDERSYEERLCYLGASANLIHWWLDQNKTYVDEYIRRLKETNIYSQVPGLYDVSKFDQERWDTILAAPTMGKQRDGGKYYLGEQLGLSPFVTQVLNPYYYKTEDGYFPDFVFDFFFNGYDAIPSLTDFTPNSEENFIKDPRGGYFHPIFGKQKIAKRLSGGEYNTLDFYEKNLPTFFREGKGISVGFAVNGGNAHAITIWGAEYDNAGNLIRLFATDTDDVQAADKDDTYLRGMVSFNTLANANGKLILNNKINPNVEQHKNFVLDTMLLDLAQDIWVDRLNDSSAPKEAIITSAPSDRVVARGAKLDLPINVTPMDAGYLEYQWYKSKDRKSKGEPIARSNKSILEFEATELGKNYYYCVVKNIKNGREISVESEHFEIDVQNIELKNAETPKLSFDTMGIKVNRYKKSKALYVNASVKDGGNLTYQWYVSTVTGANIVEGKWKKLEGETSPYFYPSTTNPGRQFYFCEVTNTNYDSSITGNSVSKVKTQFTKMVTVEDAPHIKVAEPVIIEQSKATHDVKQNQPLELKVRAKSVDGSNLSYKWVKVNADFSEDELVNETNPTLKVNTNIPGVVEYKCYVIAQNDNASSIKEASNESNRFKVSVSGDYVPSSDKSLTSLVVSNATLSPSFDPNVLNYTTSVHTNVDKLILDAKANDKARVEINNPTLSVGETNITIKVIAEDNSSQVYTITVTREASHNYGEVIYEWNSDHTKLTATRKCLDCDHFETETVDVKYDIIQHPTCTETGVGRYTSNAFTNEAFSVQTKDITLDAKGHKYGEVIYEWNSDHTKLTATRKCLDCDHFETETVDVKYDIIQHPTCTETGVGRYTSNAFTNEAFSVQTKDITLDAKGHNFGEWEIVKEPTYTETGLKRRVCECGHVEEEVIPMLEQIEKPDGQDGNGEGDNHGDVTPEPQPEVKPGEGDSTEPEVKPDEGETKPEVKPDDIVTPDENKDSNKIRIAIAVGVVVPVLLIGVLLYFLLMKFKRK